MSNGFKELKIENLVVGYAHVVPTGYIKGQLKLDEVYIHEDHVNQHGDLVPFRFGITAWEMVPRDAPEELGYGVYKELDSPGRILIHSDKGWEVMTPSGYKLNTSWENIASHSNPDRYEKIT
jgi:hypothetical protein